MNKIEILLAVPDLDRWRQIDYVLYDLVPADAYDLVVSKPYHVVITARASGDLEKLYLSLMERLQHLGASVILDVQ